MTLTDALRDEYLPDVPRPAIQPPVTCHQWCVYQDGHANMYHREDQRCHTDELFVDLTQPRDIWQGPNWELETPERLHVYAEQRPDDERPHIVVSVDGGQGPEMTAAEAQQLIENLQLVLGQIGRSA